VLSDVAAGCRRSCCWLLLLQGAAAAAGSSCCWASWCCWCGYCYFYRALLLLLLQGLAGAAASTKCCCCCWWCWCWGAAAVVACGALTRPVAGSGARVRPSGLSNTTTYSVRSKAYSPGYTRPELRPAEVAMHPGSVECGGLVLLCCCCGRQRPHLPSFGRPCSSFARGTHLSVICVQRLEGLASEPRLSHG
jgi:hypothetical protein